MLLRDRIWIMEELLGNLLTLAMLVLLQVVLGFDNLLYISLESKRAPAAKQAKVRRLGIGLAVFLRIALLFILFVVGIMLLTEGGHLAHLTLFENEIVPMTKTTFYFVIGVLVLTDIVQTRYQKKLLARKAGAGQTEEAPAAG